MVDGRDIEVGRGNLEDVFPEHPKIDWGAFGESVIRGRLSQPMGLSYSQVNVYGVTGQGLLEIMLFSSRRQALDEAVARQRSERLENINGELKGVSTAEAIKEALGRHMPEWGENRDRV